jgi:hypothetical protein
MNDPDSWVSLWVGIPPELLLGAVQGFRPYYPWMTFEEALSAMAGILSDCGVEFL